MASSPQDNTDSTHKDEVPAVSVISDFTASTVPDEGNQCGFDSSSPEWSGP